MSTKKIQMDKLKSKQCPRMMELHSKEFSFLNAEKELFNSLMNFGPPTPEKANVWLSELSEYSEGHGCLEKVFNDKQI